jgi:hypothetical protein
LEVGISILSLHLLYTSIIAYVGFSLFIFKSAIFVVSIFLFSLACFIITSGSTISSNQLFLHFLFFTFFLNNGLTGIFDCRGGRDTFCINLHTFIFSLTLFFTLICFCRHLSKFSKSKHESSL